jgi:hypothetical protein
MGTIDRVMTESSEDPILQAKQPKIIKEDGSHSRLKGNISQGQHQGL